MEHRHILILLHKWFIIFTNPSARAGYETRSIFKRSLTGLKPEFSFSCTQSYRIRMFLNSSIWPIDGTKKSTTTLGQSGPGSNGNGVLQDYRLTIRCSFVSYPILTRGYRYEDRYIRCIRVNMIEAGLFGIMAYIYIMSCVCALCVLYRASPHSTFYLKCWRLFDYFVQRAVSL